MSNILKGLNEGLADEFMAMAKAKGMNPRLAGTPEQERERTQQMLAQRAKDREQQEKQSSLKDFENIEQLKSEYEEMLRRYKSLGGSNWQYADREQNLSSGEREARSMEPALTQLGNRIARAQQHGSVSEAQKEADYGPEYQEKVKRVGQLAKEGPRKTVWDPVKRVYKTVPVNQPKKEEGVAEADQLPGTPVVSLKDLGDTDNKKNKYGQTVPEKLKKDDPRVKFHKDQKQGGVIEGLKKAVPSSERDPGALATRSHIASQEKKHSDWQERQKELEKQFYANHPELDDRKNVDEDNGQDPSEYDMEGDFVKNQIHTIIRVMTHLEKEIGDSDNLPEWVQMKISQAQGMLVGVMNYMISEKERSHEIETGEEGIHEDWQKVNKSDKTDGMSKKAVKAYRRENPGSKLKTAVTTKPSKLKPGSKDAKRRKSFCARMSGNKGPMKDEKGRPTPKAKALARWNCNEGVGDKEYRNWGEYEYELRQKAGQALDYLHEINPGMFSRYGDEFLMNLAGKLSADNPASSITQLAGEIMRQVKQEVEEGQIYSGGNKQAGLRSYKPRTVPNQDELDESDKIKGADGKACWKGKRYAGTKNGKDICVPVNKESAIMKGLQLEGNDEEYHTGGSLGTPYPSTYEQETLPYRTKGQQRTQSIAFEDKE